ncbi:hypothetical protein [Desulforamulus reducens]|uniref:hypothetical protein n=1 Tax=Desulforamulus reducens TaxID=59610 RepID=UPI0002DF2134|nr:hypothetical protein [Desulforamulus reducens]
MDVVMSLFIPFVMLCAICILVDKLTLALEALVHAIPGLPDRFEPYIAYVFVFIGGFVVCWRMDWSFFYLP